MPPIQDHPLRYQLSNEMHARPFPAIQNPCRVAYLAVKQPSEAVQRDRSLDWDHLIDLLDRHGAPHPQPGATHHSAQIGRNTLKWESHTEFVSYTVFIPGLTERAFDPVDFSVFPDDWLEAAPGQRVTSILVRVENRDQDRAISESLNEWFVPESLAVGHVHGGVAVAAGDFRIDPAGHMRFVVFAGEKATERQIGRIVQWLYEIETYKAMSMLGFSRVRRMEPQIGTLDAQLTELMIGLSDGGAPADGTLQRLLKIATELETQGASAAFRFAATGAYEAIVNQRIELLRERRFGSRQTFAEFMLRRFEPAMRTVQSTERRLARLADRAMRAGELLRTQVDVERSAQNQALLESMDRRADTALRLQATVEGLSVVAISYYAVSLASYALYPLTAALDVSKGMITAAITLPVVAGVWMAVRRIRRTYH
ncbi:MAG: DUF3422 family protein [Paracoccaceae bacterium]